MKTWHYQLWTIAVGVTLATMAYGQFPDYPQPNLPALEVCQNPIPQPLPVQWEATTLMAPYLYSGDPFDFSNLPSRASLVVGKFVYHAEESLMRVTQVSVSLPDRLDLLITSGPTYVLGGDFSDPERLWSRSPYLTAGAPTTTVGGRGILPVFWRHPRQSRAQPQSEHASDWLSVAIGRHATG